MNRGAKLNIHISRLALLSSDWIPKSTMSSMPKHSLISEKILHATSFWPTETPLSQLMDLSCQVSDFDTPCGYKNLALNMCARCWFDCCAYHYCSQEKPRCRSWKASSKYASNHLCTVSLFQTSRGCNDWHSIFLFSRYNLDPSKTCMIGDRLDTDIDFGLQGGIETLCVLTGTKPRNIFFSQWKKFIYYVLQA